MNGAFPLALLVLYRLHPGKELRLQLELLPLLGRPCQNAGKAAEVVCCNKKIPVPQPLQLPPGQALVLPAHSLP